MEEFQVRLEQIGGCGDGGCMIHVRPGMHTNGGCRCSTNPFKMRQTVHAYKGAVAEQAQEIGRLRAQKDGAYSERDRLVCALSKIFPSWLERHPLTDTSWDDDWRWIVFINFPTGQGSWHIHKSEHPWFEHLDVKSSNSWDGHTNDQKYDRVAALQPKEGEK